jgi:two-component system CheB/CheR fusion protein
VVLSGTDSDGALGLKAIKGEGGITMVQSPESARFSEMPRSSISNDHVDRILPPAQLANELGQLGSQFRHPALRPLEDGAPQPGDEHQFSRIVNLLRSVSGVDFRLYKPTTIRRRIARRMLLHRSQTLGEYAGFLQGNPKELRELQEDALINVTRFFRDPPVFEALKQIILPRIFEEREPDQQVRIWVAGCSSGEEAYSIAISLLEYLTGQPFEPPIQIFGTDASDLNIQKARTGIYPESIAGEVSAERLRRFFVKVDKGYQVSKRVRDLCIFARQNLCHDPPFSKMDLISCRNVLIYLGADLQKQILPTFHYALRSSGYLLLGTSETIREFTELYQMLDRKHKFFAKIPNSNSRSILGIAPRIYLPDTAAQPPLTGIQETWGDMELQRAADRIVLARYGPPGVVIDEKQEILQSRGHTSAFMEMPQGSVTLQLTRMLRDSISSPVTHAVQRAVEQDIPVRVEGLRVSEDDQDCDVTLEVLPIHTMAPRSRCFLVLFAPAQAAKVEVRDRDALPGWLRSRTATS